VVILMRSGICDAAMLFACIAIVAVAVGAGILEPGPVGWFAVEDMDMETEMELIVTGDWEIARDTRGAGLYYHCIMRRCLDKSRVCVSVSVICIYVYAVASEDAGRWLILIPILLVALAPAQRHSSIPREAAMRMMAPLLCFYIFVISPVFFWLPGCCSLTHWHTGTHTPPHTHTHTLGALSRKGADFSLSFRLVSFRFLRIKLC